MVFAYSMLRLIVCIYRNSAIFFSPFKTRVRHFFAELCNTITRQPIELESCSNPLRIRKIFLLRLKNYFWFWVWGFCGWHHNRGMFSRFLANVTWPWPLNPTSDCLAHVSFENESLVDFLAYLEPKLSRVISLEVFRPLADGLQLAWVVTRTKGAFCVWGHLRDIWC